jgi:hypothetical protein
MANAAPAIAASEAGSRASKARFICEALSRWLPDKGTATIPVTSRRLWENGYFESFTSRFRDEFLEVEGSNWCRTQRRKGNGSGANTTRFGDTVRWATRCPSAPAPNATVACTVNCPKVNRYSHLPWTKKRGTDQYEKLWGMTWDELVALKPELGRLLGATAYSYFVGHPYVKHISQNCLGHRSAWILFNFDKQLYLSRLSEPNHQIALGESRCIGCSTPHVWVNMYRASWGRESSIALVWVVKQRQLVVHLALGEHAVDFAR